METPKTPKVSIIVPVYNSEKFLNKCLDSLINQTLEDIEIICVNDGSTDNSLKILQEYAAKDKRIQIIDKQNEGLSATRNQGIDRATGEYIGFVDSDDRVDLNFFEKLYLSAQKYDADIAVGEIIRLNKFNKKIHLKLEKETVTDDFETKLILCDVPDKSYVWNKIYKTEELKKHNLKFLYGRIYEDVVYTPQVLYCLNKLVTVPGTHYYYWRNPNSLVTSRAQKANEDSVWARNEAKNFLISHNIDITKIKTQTKRYKLFGFSVFKIQKKGNKTTYVLFNIIKWQA